MLKEGELVGAIGIFRQEVRPFTDKQIELVTNFADQAVIAIENVRLFEEVQERTRELAHSVEELRALGEVTRAVNSTLDLETVLSTIVAKAAQLSGTEAGAIYVFDECEQAVPAARHLRHERGDDCGDPGPACRHVRSDPPGDPGRKAAPGRRSRRRAVEPGAGDRDASSAFARGWSCR